MTGFSTEDSLPTGSPESAVKAQADSALGGHIWVISNQSALSGELIQKLPSTVQSTTIFHSGQSALAQLAQISKSQNLASSPFLTQTTQKISQQSVEDRKSTRLNSSH